MQTNLRTSICLLIYGLAVIGMVHLYYHNIPLLAKNVSSMYTAEELQQDIEYERILQYQINQTRNNGVDPDLVLPDGFQETTINTSWEQLNQSKPKELRPNPNMDKVTASWMSENIVNPFPYRFLTHNQHLCTSSPNLKYIVYVYSFVTNFIERKLFRKNWAQMDLFQDWPSRIIFIVGQTKAPEKYNNLLKNEQDRYGDIVMVSLRETYENLTYKGMAALKWIKEYCPNVEFVIKTDDDIQVDIFQVRNILENMSPEKDRFILGNGNSGTVILRKSDPKCKKWCIPDDVLPDEKIFPKYLSGCVHIFPRHMVGEMFEAALRTPYLQIEDAYFTGIIPIKMGGVRLVDMGTCRVDTGDDFAVQYKNPSYKDEKWMAGEFKNTRRMMKAWDINLEVLNEEQIGWIGREKYDNMQNHSKN